jgi:hypothetical protein
MANYFSSPQVDGVPISDERSEIKVFSGLDFGTGAINTGVVYDIGKFEKRMLYVDVTGANTGGVSAAHTIALYAKPTNWPAWVQIGQPTVTNTAYVFSVNPTGIALSALWCPIENLKIVYTNTCTGTSTNTKCTATVNITLSLKK